MGLLEDILDGLWDFTFGTDLDALQSIYNLLASLSATLIDLLFGMMYLIFYPVLVFFGTVYDIVSFTYALLMQFLNTFIDIPNTAWFVVTNTITPWAPPIWIWILFAILSVRIGFILFNRIEGVSVFGWKV